MEPAEWKSYLEKLLEEHTQILSNKFKDLADQVTVTNNHVKILETRTVNTDGNVKRLDRKSRKNNIVIYRLDEENNESIFNVLSDFFQTLLGIPIGKKDLNNAYRIGSPTTNDKCRPILVEFLSYFTRAEVISSAYKLKGTNFAISDDLCPEDVLIRKKLLMHQKKAKAKGYTAKIRKDTLIINEDIYTIHQLDQEEDSLITRNFSGSENLEATTSPETKTIPSTSGQLNKSKDLLRKPPSVKRGATSPTNQLSKLRKKAPLPGSANVQRKP